MKLEYAIVDAFTDRPLYGNAAAVVFDADELSTETMQKIAREMNLSETVFILQPTNSLADYRARIFTPKNELPFAGHPTVAAAHSFLTRNPEKANSTLLRQECIGGLIPVEIVKNGSSTLFRMTQLPPKYSATTLSNSRIAAMLGCSESDLENRPFEVVSTGVPWLIIELNNIKALSNLNVDQSLVESECKAIGACGITVFSEKQDAGNVRLRLRSFAPGEGIAEDPVCGSGNGCVAAFIARHSHPDDETGSYVSEQGIEIGRDGEIHVSWQRGEDKPLEVRVAGEAVTFARGELHV